MLSPLTGMRKACRSDMKKYKDAKIETLLLGRVFNGAHAIMNGSWLVVTYNGHKAAPEDSECVTEHSVHFEAINCECEVSKQFEVAELPPIALHRKCYNERNFRSNGPEDARLLVVNDKNLVALYNDFRRTDDDENKNWTRSQFIVTLQRNSNGSFSLGPRRHISLANVSRLEKNWVPFITNARFYAQRYLLDNQLRTITIEINYKTAAVRKTYLSESRWLRTHLNGTHVSGGTNAVRLNQTHFLAIGHTRFGEKNRIYRMFGYLFSAYPPFEIIGLTPEFNLRTTRPVRLRPDGVHLRERGKPLPSSYFVAEEDSLVFDLNASTTRLLNHKLTLIQFPMGLSLLDSRSGSHYEYHSQSSPQQHADQNENRLATRRKNKSLPFAHISVRLSWSNHDMDSFLSTFTLNYLMSKVRLRR